MRAAHLTPESKAVASTIEAPTVSGTLMSRNTRVLRNDSSTRSSVSTVMTLSNPTNGFATSRPGAVKK